MSASRKHRGYATQRIVADYLREWFPYAEPVGAGRAGSDITGTPGVEWEVKARRGFPVIEAMRQASERAADGIVPAVVLRPDGWGPARIAAWPFVVPLEVGVILLRAAGYGTPIEDPPLVCAAGSQTPSRCPVCDGVGALYATESESRVCSWCGGEGVVPHE